MTMVVLLSVIQNLILFMNHIKFCSLLRISVIIQYGSQMKKESFRPLLLVGSYYDALRYYAIDWYQIK